MNTINRKKPMKLAYMEAAIRRLYEEDPEYPNYLDAYKKISAGYAGEQRVDREWTDIQIPSNYYLLNDLSFIHSNGHSHQVDTVFICPNFALVLEVKNITGRILFDETIHQFIRIKPDNSIDGFPNPLDQITRHTRALQNYFHDIIRDFPVIPAIVFPFASSIVEKVPSTTRIFHITGLQVQLNKLYQDFPHPQLTSNQLTQLVKLLKGLQQPMQTMSKLPLNRIKHGVLCSHCSYKTHMQYRKRGWQCPKCHAPGYTNFLEALSDYRLLVSEQMTNQMFRDFFRIAAPSTARKMLRNLQLEYTGTFKNRAYILSNQLFEQT